MSPLPADVGQRFVAEAIARAWAPERQKRASVRLPVVARLDARVTLSDDARAVMTADVGKIAAADVSCTTPAIFDRHSKGRDAALATTRRRDL